MFSFDHPSISANTYNTRATISSEMFSVTGSGFAHTVHAKVEFSRCEETFWHSQTGISCRRARGIGRSLKFAVTTSLLAGSSTHAISYMTPVASGAKHANAGTHGAEAIRIWGTGLGLSSLGGVGG